MIESASIIKTASFISVGLLAGIASGIFGIGGGVIVVPALVLIVGLSQHSAQGTSLVALLLPVGIFGVIEYFRAGKIGMTEIKLGLQVAIGMFGGVFLGSKLAVGISSESLRKAFAVFLVLIAGKLWLMK